jgi:hypothetical protein
MIRRPISSVAEGRANRSPGKARAAMMNSSPVMARGPAAVVPARRSRAGLPVRLGIGQAMVFLRFQYVFYIKNT